MKQPTIFALATPAGRGGVAVIRLSGDAIVPTVTALTGGAAPPPRRAVRARLIDPASGDALDDGLIVLFSKPNSYTGEDVAELHLHGSLAVVGATLRVLGSMPGLRLAEPGEFTRRA